MLYKPTTMEKMTLSKIFYFLLFSALAALTPYLVIYYDILHFSGRQIGVLTALFPLIALISSPLFGGIADATKKHHSVMMVSVLGSIIFTFVLSITTTFIGLLIAVILFSFFYSPIMPLLDDSTMNLLGKHRDRYGKIRIWGAVGWGVTAPLIGVLIDRSGIRWAFYGYIISMSIGLVVAWFMPFQHTHSEEKYWQNFRILVSNRKWVIFLISAFTTGMAYAMALNFLFLYLNQLGASKTLMGVSMVFGTISELPFWFFSNRLLNRWSMKGLIIFSMGLLAVRFFAYSLIRIPWMVIPINLLHGATFSVFWIVGVSYAAKSAPEGLSATAQSLFSSVMFGIASVVGALLGGFLYDSIGASKMFQTSALVVLIGLFIFILGDKHEDNRISIQKSEKSKLI